MSTIPKKTTRKVLEEENPQTPDDIMNTLREMFLEVLEEALVIDVFVKRKIPHPL